MEKNKAEYSNEADLIDDDLRDVEKNVEQMRNDAVEKRSRISRKENGLATNNLIKIKKKITKKIENFEKIQNSKCHGNPEKGSRIYRSSTL